MPRGSKPQPMKFPHLCLAFLALAASCKQEREIKVYRVAKDTPGADPHAGVPGMMPGGVMPDGATGGSPCRTQSRSKWRAATAGAGPAGLRHAAANWKKQPPTLDAAGQLPCRGRGRRQHGHLAHHPPRGARAATLDKRQPLARPARPGTPSMKPASRTIDAKQFPPRLAMRSPWISKVLRPVRMPRRTAA